MRQDAAGARRRYRRRRRTPVRAFGLGACGCDPRLRLAAARRALQHDGVLPRPLAARGESLAAFDERCIPASGVAPPSNTPGILSRRALPAGRLARLGATPDFHHGLLGRMAYGLWMMARSLTIAISHPPLAIT